MFKLKTEYPAQYIDYSNIYWIEVKEKKVVNDITLSCYIPFKSKLKTEELKLEIEFSSWNECQVYFSKFKFIKCGSKLININKMLCFQETDKNFTHTKGTIYFENFTPIEINLKNSEMVAFKSSI